MNILLNNYCNLKCEYCFANKVLDEDKEDLSMNNFKYLLDFLDESKETSVRLLGGEPTLHPQFTDMILEAFSRGSVQNILIFTNGLFEERVGILLERLAEKKSIALLINYNKPEILGKRHEILLNHLRFLSNTKVKLTLGINFYEPDQDFSYIIEAAKKYNVDSIRYSVTVPNTDTKKHTDLRTYFKSYVPVVKEFIRACTDNNIRPTTDCNNIPLCMMDDETLRELALRDESTLMASVCHPVLDVKPNMDVIRCFAMSELPVSIKDYNNIEELNNYFIETIDKGYENKPIFDECKSCPSYSINNNRSCACLAFYDKEE